MNDGPSHMPSATELRSRRSYSNEKLHEQAGHYLKGSMTATDAAFYPIRAQVFLQELQRREQNKQSWIMVVCTIVITLLTVIIAIATVCPELLPFLWRKLFLSAPSSPLIP